MAGKVILEMRGIVKRFPGVLANDHIDFDLREGEIHALLGENGAGKTTLMNILYGIHQPDEGEIIIDGRPVKFRSPRDAIAMGIGMVHQHFKLVEKHTVAENVALGYARRVFRPLEDVKDKILEYGERYGLKVDPDAYIWQLSAGEKQRVEIIKALFAGARILILDEPTSVLTPQESEELFHIVKKMREDGKSIIFITHKLREVMEVGDRATVLRKGKKIATLEVSETSPRELARLMVGREVLFEIVRPQKEIGEPVLKVEDLWVLNDKGLPAVRGVSFEVRRGEIFGIAGVAGNGQRELVEALTGLRRVEKGRILLMGKDVTNSDPGALFTLGLSHIPEERIKMGIVPNLTVMENMILKMEWKQPFRKGMFLDFDTIENYAEERVKEFDIYTPSVKVPARTLSGGNIQKLILAREISVSPKVIIAAHPTYGLDVAATEYIRNRLAQESAKGAAIFLVSEELDEVFQLSDRFAVMFNGEFMGVVRPGELTREEVGLMMMGKRLEEVRGGA